jgi:hypothetical protein
MLKETPFDERVLGVKIHYEDGSVVRLTAEELAQGWADAPEFGVQVVAIFPREKRNGKYYPQWFASRDLYAFSPTEGIIETNDARDLPADAVVKIGTEMDKDAFRNLYNHVMHDHEF